jgi:copper homeostasis protein
MNPSLPRNVLLEICVTSLEYAIAAQRAGADRIELCSDLDCGGITPRPGLMEATRTQLRIPIHALIRPRPGDFFYSAQEFSAMRRQIQNAKDLNMDGVVLGVLDKDSQIDIARTRQLVEFAHPLPVTFHRAFDEIRSWQKSLEAVMQTGAVRLLTSGCSPNAIKGLSTLTELVRQANGRLSVIPASGITPANVLRVVRTTSAREIHGSMLTPALRKSTKGEDRRLQIERYYRRVRKMVSLLLGH